jgi:glucan phosphoethanolaminetransferase (alkaline phosphatase superfamily)
MKSLLYRYSMLISAAALLALSIYYFINYAGIAVAVSKSPDMSEFHQHSIRGLWLTFASQSLLFALLYFLVAWRPRSVTREVIVICGLLQMVAAILIFSFAGSTLAVNLLAVAALFVLIGSVLWPSEEEVTAEKVRKAAAIVAGATAPSTPAVQAPPADNSGL